MKNMKRKVVSLALASTMLVGSTGFAAKMDIVNRTTSESKSFSTVLRSGSALRDLIKNQSNYLVEGDEGKLYNVSEVQRLVEEQGLTFDEAIKIAPPVENTSELKVESISAINGSQVEIKFNKAVDKSTVITGSGLTANLNSNISIVAVAPTTVNPTVVPGKVSLSEDGKTLTITTNALKGNYSVTVSKNVLSTSGEAMEAYSKAFSIDEKVAPVVTEVKSSTNGAVATSVTLKFSEPVRVGAAIKVNGVQVGTTSANDTSTTVSGLNLDATKSHTIEIVNLTDIVGNVTALTTKTFNVTQDVALPTIASIEAKSDTHLLVTFDKKVKLSTVNNSNYSAVDASTNTVIGLNNATSVSGDASDTKFLIPITTPANLFINTNSKTLNVLFTANIEDTLGNKLAPSTKSVTITKDAVAPQVTSISYNKSAGTHGSLVINFSESINKTGKTATVSLLNPDGTANTTLITAQAQAGTLSNDDKTLTLPLAIAAPTSGNYTVILAKGYVADKAATPNDSVAYTGTVNLGTTVAEVKVNSAAETSSNSNVIRVTFSETVKGGAIPGSATDVANYSLGGKALPAGTLITLAANKLSVDIVLPAESIEKSDAASILTVNNVEGTVSGATLTPFTGTVNVMDNVKPVLQSAKVLNNKQIELTYSEKLANIAALTDVTSNFTVYEGTVAKVLPSTAKYNVISQSGYPTKLVLELVDAGTPATPATVTTFSAGGSNAGSAALPTHTGTFTGTVNETITIEKTAGGYSINGGSDETGLTATYKGLTITLPTGSATTGDVWTATSSGYVAAIPGVTFDESKTIEVETILTGTVIKDLAATANTQKSGTRITATK